MQDSMGRAVTWLESSQVLRLLLLAFLALLLLVPITMIDGLVSERRSRREAAIEEVSAKWGRLQTITGPALMVPYTHRWEEALASGEQVTRSETRQAVFLPRSLNVRGTVHSEVRRRGIYTVPLYTLRATVAGEFSAPDFAALGVDPAAVAWERAQLVVGLSDARAIQEQTAVTWNDRTVAFVPGTGDFKECEAGIHAPVDVEASGRHLAFSFPLSLNGSVSLHFVPLGEDTTVELDANSGDPSFQGNWLPAERTIEQDSFRARWSIPFLGRNYPQVWRSDGQMRSAIEASRFGVALVSGVDHYRMAERSVKYAFLFVLLTFALMWLIEVLASVRVHPIQYLLLGGALCLFYLLELSLSEHLGFALAYTIASAAVVGMVAGYGRAVLHRAARALVVAGGVALLYVYLYMLLMNEDYALLVGSIGLFAILAGIMFATRKVDWYAGAAAGPGGAGKAGT